MTNIQEIYVPIAGYEGYYEVSNMANIKSLPSLRVNQRKTEFILNPIITRTGYHEVKLCKYGKGVRYRIHKLVALHFCENPYNKPSINHIDGDKSNNISSNLEWCTAKENTQHGIEMGLIDSRGELNGNSKLKPEDVLKIREMNISDKNVAYMFNITTGTIRDILTRRTWKHL